MIGLPYTHTGILLYVCFIVNECAVSAKSHNVHDVHKPANIQWQHISSILQYLFTFIEVWLIFLWFILGTHRAERKIVVSCVNEQLNWDMQHVMRHAYCILPCILLLPRPNLVLLKMWTQVSGVTVHHSHGLPRYDFPVVQTRTTSFALMKCR